MAPRPDNFFVELASVSVLYDRLTSGHYGTTGVARDFHCTVDTQEALERCFEELLERTAPHFGSASVILSAGAWVNKPGQHGLGQAFDLDAIHWERAQFVALNQPQIKPLYLAVEALCHKHFGVVLDYHYNLAHRDHLHIDVSREVKFRETKSVTSFIQEAVNTLYGQSVVVDGEWGYDTSEALQEALVDLGIGDIAKVKNWRAFLDATFDRAVAMAASLEGGESVSLAAPLETSVEQPDLAPDANPELAALEEPDQIAGAQVLAIRPHTSRIDVNYRPFPTWSISKDTSGSKPTWFLEYDHAPRFYLGYRFEFDNYVGLARTGNSSVPNISYDHQAYRPAFGEWASFVYPTGRCESEAKFLVVNAWDAAAMTLGFFQLAAHTGEHLVRLLRDLINALPDEADRFFPELKLGSQIGESQADHLFAVNGTDRLDLDVPAAHPDGKGGSSWYRGRLMAFFNPNRGEVDAEELATTARWVAWLTTSAAAREVCVRNAVDVAKTTVGSVHRYVRGKNHPKYPNGLDGVAMSLVAAAMDVRHHGRRNPNTTALDSVFAALIAPHPLQAFKTIDTGWRRRRSERSVIEIDAMGSWFAGKVYDEATNGFRVAP